MDEKGKERFFTEIIKRICFCIEKDQCLKIKDEQQEKVN